MVKALRRWLEANELLAIVTGVVSALLLLSMLLVLGGYFLVTR
jgi:tetrahydromethanopterin S-methyltransferase subunit F